MSMKLAWRDAFVKRMYACTYVYVDKTENFSPRKIREVIVIIVLIMSLEEKAFWGWQYTVKKFQSFHSSQLVAELSDFYESS